MNEIITQNWKEFNLIDLFSDEEHNIESCKCSNATALLEPGNEVMYIGAKKNDNGFRYYVMHSEEYITKGNCIVFICDGDGSVGYHTYQEDDFIGSTTLKVGRNNNLNRYNALFLLTVLDFARYKFSFGRKYKVENEKVALPYIKTEDGFEPDWIFMENYIKILIKEQKKILSKMKSPFGKNNSNDSVKSNEWKEFELRNVFQQIYKAKAHVKQRIETNDNKNVESISFITRTEKNNGHDTYIALKSVIEKEKGNAIIIGDTTATIFYQEDDFATGDHIVVCRAEKMNKYSGLFLRTIIEKERYKYSYGRAFKKDLIENTIVRLPSVEVNGENQPNWQFMEDYIKQFPLIH